MVSGGKRVAMSNEGIETHLFDLPALLLLLSLLLLLEMELELLLLLGRTGVVSPGPVALSLKALL